MSNEWGRALKKFRERTNLSQGKFCDEASFLWMDLSETEFEELRDIIQADQLILTNTTISRYEKGRRQPPQRRTQHLALIWTLHKLNGIRTPFEANTWLQLADRASLTIEEQRSIFGDVVVSESASSVNGGLPSHAPLVPEQSTFIWSSGSAVQIISSTAVILGALALVIVGTMLWRDFIPNFSQPSTGGDPNTPVVKRSPTPEVTPEVTPNATAIDNSVISVPITQTLTPLSTTVNTSMPLTKTVAPPTDTPIPPSSTSVPPTNTVVPPTGTPIPPTDTRIPPTDIPIPPTVTQTSSPFRSGESRVFAGINLVYVPRGPFLMGSSSLELEIPRGFCNDYGSELHCGTDIFGDESPQFRVSTSDFWIMQTEVTNAQFREFVEGDGYTNKAYWTSAGWQWREENAIRSPSRWNNPNLNQDNHPVAGVSWYESVAYSKWLSQRSGLNFRLPTEAEWEKAARGSNGLIFPWGNEWDPTRVNYCDANCDEEIKDNNSNDGYAFTSPVGQYESGKSPYNAYDMVGNVWEWTSTIYDQNLFPYPYEPDARENLSGTYDRVWRGGSWYNLPYMLRGANHNGNSSDIRWAGVGFRLVLSP